MERRVLIAVILSFLVLYGYQALFVPAPPPPGSQAGQQAPAAGGAPAAIPPSAAPSAAPSAPAPAAAAPAAPVPASPATVTDTAERTIVVETATVEATLTNRGGRVLSWKLKEYRDNGVPLDLVPSALPANQPTPFALRIDEDPQLTERLNTALYRVSGDVNGRVDARTSEGGVVFEFEDASGLRVRKELRFDPRTYIVSFSANVNQGDRALNPSVQWGPGLGDLGASSAGGSFFTGNYIQPPQAIFHRAGEVERVVATDLGEQPVQEGEFRFVGVDDHYFIATAINAGRRGIPGRHAARQR
jgi:YidC/Oxa1 family membrane protein insertase